MKDNCPDIRRVECEQRVAAGHICVTSSGLPAKFPEDLWLQQIGAESYIGVPMRNAQGRTLGHLAVLHQEPMEPSEEDIAVLQILAARGCAELERKQAHEKLSKAHEDLRPRRAEQPPYRRPRCAASDRHLHLSRLPARLP